MLTKDGKPDRRKRWHNECGLTWRIANNPTVARMALFSRDKGCCAMCGVDTTVYETPSRMVSLDVERILSWCAVGMAKAGIVTPPDMGRWHADHIYPLWLVDRDAPDALRRWGLDNLQTLCHACHEFKTTQEAASRAKTKRLRGETKVKKPRTKSKYVKSPSGKVRLRKVA